MCAPQHAAICQHAVRYRRAIMLESCVFVCVCFRSCVHKCPRGFSCLHKTALRSMHAPRVRVRGARRRCILCGPMKPTLRPAWGISHCKLVRSPHPC